MPDLSLNVSCGDLTFRFNRLIKHTRSVIAFRSLWVGAVALLLIVAVAVPDLVAGNSPTGAVGLVQEKQEAAEKKTMVVKAIGPDGQPMSGVHILASIGAGTPNQPDMTVDPNQMLYSDEQGRVTVALPKEFFIVRLWARADGCAPLFCNWESNDIASGD